MLKYKFAAELPESILEKLRKHSDGAENLNSRTMKCHYCEHNAVVVFEDSRGHIKVKCKKCGEESIYNLQLRRSSSIVFWYS